MLGVAILFLMRRQARRGDSDLGYSESEIVKSLTSDGTPIERYFLVGDAIYTVNKYGDISRRIRVDSNIPMQAQYDYLKRIGMEYFDNVDLAREFSMPGTHEEVDEMRKKDFYELLGPESEEMKCRVEGCDKGRIEISPFCRDHHVENLRKLGLAPNC